VSFYFRRRPRITITAPESKVKALTAEAGSTSGAPTIAAEANVEAPNTSKNIPRSVFKGLPHQAK
jgi:hypothetical protein